MLAGCAGCADAGSDPNNPNQVEVDHLVDVRQREDRASTTWSPCSRGQNPELQFVDASVAAAAAPKARAGDRRPARAPTTRPTRFQTAGGAGLTDYVANGELQDLTSLYTENGLTEASTGPRCSSS